MYRKLAIAAGTAAIMTLALSPASAITAGPYTPVPGATNGVGGLQVEQVQAGRCRYWAGVCASRWGVGTWRFRRCMALHGC